MAAPALTGEACLASVRPAGLMSDCLLSSL